MIMLSQVCDAVKGQLVNQSGGADLAIGGVSINTRSNCVDRLFVAIKGDNFDAHEFVQQAKEAGACALLVERNVESSLPTIKVKDTRQALADLSTWWRSNFDIPVVGVTGSVGKTSVKEMLACIFSELGRGIATKGNLNNELGVPLTLMRLAKNDKYAIVEMGMNNAGEIARITKMARPTIALINNAAAAHLEGLGSIEAVADAKAEIFQGLSEDGVAIINKDDRFANDWLAQTKQFRQLTFSLETDADITASFQEKGDDLIMSVRYQDQCFDIAVHALGEHNARNSLAAIAVSIASSISIEKIQSGLRAYRPVVGRLNRSHVGQLTLIDDTYNANPLSMLAAINVLVKYPSNTLIVGDMAELGDAAEAEHALLGQRAAESGVSNLLVCGSFAHTVVESFKKTSKDSKESAIAFVSQSELIKYAIAHISSGTVLVKGSRSAAMERVVNALIKSKQNASSAQGGIH